MSTQEYQVQIGGRYVINDQVVACPRCRADQGLTFTTFAQGQRVRGVCPNAHAWTDRRVPPENIRAAVEATLR